MIKFKVYCFSEDNLKIFTLSSKVYRKGFFSGTVLSQNIGTIPQQW